MQESGAYTSLVETLHSLHIRHRYLTHPEIWVSREQRTSASVLDRTVETCSNHITPTSAVPAFI